MSLPDTIPQEHRRKLYPSKLTKYLIELSDPWPWNQPVNVPEVVDWEKLSLTQQKRVMEYYDRHYQKMAKKPFGIPFIISADKLRRHLQTLGEPPGPPPDVAQSKLTPPALRQQSEPSSDFSPDAAEVKLTPPPATRLDILPPDVAQARLTPPALSQPPEQPSDRARDSSEPGKLYRRQLQRMLSNEFDILPADVAQARLSPLALPSPTNESHRQSPLALPSPPGASARDLSDAGGDLYRQQLQNMLSYRPALAPPTPRADNPSPSDPGRPIAIVLVTLALLGGVHYMTTVMRRRFRRRAVETLFDSMLGEADIGRLKRGNSVKKQLALGEVSHATEEVLKLEDAVQDYFQLIGVGPIEAQVKKSTKTKAIYLHLSPTPKT